MVPPSETTIFSWFVDKVGMDCQRSSMIGQWPVQIVFMGEVPRPNGTGEFPKLFIQSEGYG